MAEIQVKSAFVDKVLIGKDGPFGIRTSEPHSRKVEGGYETTGRTFRTVKGRGIDWELFQERDRVAFFGREVTEEREHDGKKFYDLVVFAEAVSVLPRRGGESADSPRTQSADSEWASGGDGFGDSTPF